MRRPLALLGALHLALVGCDNPRDNFLGSVTSGQGGAAAGGQGGSGVCGGDDCSTRIFSEPSAPPNARDLFARSAPRANGSAAAREPELIYPSDETRLPRNLGRMRFEWTAAGNSLFELAFRGATSTVLVYTAQNELTTTPALWQALTELPSGSEAIEVSVRALALSAPEEAFSSAARRLSFGAALAGGAIYYWSSTAHGILRASLGDAPPQKLAIGPPDACSGCHSISRDGSRIALDAGDGRLRVEEVAMLATQPVGGSGGGGGMAGMPLPGKLDKSVGDAPALWSAFSPDGKWLLGALNGSLSLMDGATGAPAKADPIALPAKSSATHPDWSPAGDRVAFTLAEVGKGRAIERGSIASASFDGERFGPVEVWVQSAGPDDNNLFPSFSPDGQYLAYVSARGPSDNAATANIRLLRLADRLQFELPRLNTRVNNQSGSELGNTMPTWARATSADQLWLSFSSLRAYASVRPADRKLDQLWLAAIDPSLDDPGLPAFWAPFQDLGHANHRALWGQEPATPSCGCQELCADGVDNDCDGTVDEAGCSVCAAREVCDDGVDNDCDCVIDDCSVEICADGLDNDGDRFADDADLSCTAP